ncbi:MAG: hypothetical protein U1F43_34495 [Myxococcota bacterium]
MSRSVATFAVLASLAVSALGAAGCPSDPTFRLGDTVDDAEVAPDSTSAPDSGDDANDANDASDVNTCGATCGPAMQCLDGSCRCTSPDCDEPILASGVGRVRLAIGFAPAPSVAYVRPGAAPDMNVATWSTCCGWSSDLAIAQAAETFDAIIDPLGHLQLLGLGAEGVAVIQRHSDDGWARRDTDVAPCHRGTLQLTPRGDGLVMGCVDDLGALRLFDYDTFGDGYHARGTPALDVGAAATTAPGDRVPLVLDGDGRVHVAFARDGAPSGRQIVVADETVGGWESAPVELVPEPLIGLVPVAMALDRDQRLHLVTVRDDAGGGRTLLHDRRDATWSYEEPLQGAALGIHVLALTRGAGTAMALLYDDGAVLHWWSFSHALDPGAADHATLDLPDGVASAAMVVGDGDAFVAFTTATGALRLWRPSAHESAPAR